MLFTKSFTQCNFVRIYFYFGFVNSLLVLELP